MKPILLLLPALLLFLSLNSAKPKVTSAPDNSETAIMVKRIIHVPQGMLKFVWAGTVRDHGFC